MFKRNYSITKSRRILKRGFAIYKKRSTTLLTSQYIELENNLKALDKAIGEKDKKEASRLAKNLESFLHAHFPKNGFDYAKELFGALLFAIVVAFCIRQFWFELYEVPTGSMRPTILEKDRLLVSKTPFGINLPFTNRLWLFHEDRIQRGGAIVFTTEGMNVADSDMRYFLLFPGKKRFVKRCVARGGDTIYFYGGQIYGIDRKGKEIKELSDPSWLAEHNIGSIDHIPFISFEGNVKTATPLMPQVYSEVTLRQMQEPLGKIRVHNKNMEGLFFDGTNWTKEKIHLLKEPHSKPVSYGDLWGMNNYAMTRILTKNEVQSFYPDQTSQTELTLEIRHTPNLTYPSPQLRQSERFVVQPMITPFITLLPLEEEQLDRLLQTMYTIRFVVRNEKAYRYSESRARPQPVQFDPRMVHVPDGTYEFQNGIAYAVHLGGIRTTLSKDHPLYAKELLPALFNMGTNFNTLYQPTQPYQPFIPQRFAYYRNGALFVMGAPLFSEKEIAPFVASELAKQSQSSDNAPYIAFIDRGAPLKEGMIDKEFIKAFGLHVPEMTVVALGDNYANSGDSREFGFVPAHNLRGAPSFTFWPPSNRVGPLPQPSYPWITLPNFIVWGSAALIILATLLFIRKKNRTRLFYSALN